MDPVAVAASPRLALLARTSFVTTLVSAVLSLILLAAQVDIFLLHHPPAQLGAVASAGLKAVATGGTVLGVLATIVGFVLRRISKRLAQAEGKRERLPGVVGNVAGQLQGAPEQIARLQAGQGCSFPITVGVLGVSLAVATITYIPAQQIAVTLNNPFPSAQATVTHKLPSGTINEFGTPTQQSRLYGITSGPDGALWFTKFETDQIGRITTSGSVTEFAVPTAFPGSSAPFGITSGPDGALWFTESTGEGKIGRITTSGSVTEFAIPNPNNIANIPEGITSGPDGALWFAEYEAGKIGRITTAGSITEFALPVTADGRLEGPEGIVSGPDGALWFTEYGGQIGRITTGGSVTEFAVPAASSTSTNEWGITRGPDGALWFTEYDENKIGRITTAGSVTQFAVPTAGSCPEGIASGPDSALWFTENCGGGKIGRITTTGHITEFAVPNVGSGPWGIVSGPDGALWFTELHAGQIGMLVP